MMTSNSGIPQVSTAGRRPATSNQRALASSVTAPANVIASLKDEVRHLTGMLNRFEMQIAAQDQRIAALELLLSASTKSRASTASAGTRMTRNAEISVRIYDRYPVHNRADSLSMAYTRIIRKRSRQRIMSTSERTMALV